MTLLSIRGRIQALPIGLKLSSSAIGVMLVTLCTAVGVVSVQAWQRASEQGTRLLADAATSTSALLKVYDDTARKAALKDIGLFQREFDPAGFALSEATTAWLSRPDSDRAGLWQPSQLTPALNIGLGIRGTPRPPMPL